MRDDHSGLLIDRLAASIVDESLPLKDVEKELRGSVAEVAVKKRGLGKREIASRCGVTEKSIDNYLKEARSNPKSPEREIARLLQDGPLSLEEIYESVRPVLCHGRYFTLDDAKRALDKLIRTGEAEELPGKKYRSSQKPTIRVPMTVEAYRDLVDEKARDMDYIILTQKEVGSSDLPPRKTQQFSRVVGDTNLVRIDFTVDVAPEDLPDFYEKLSAEIARLTLKYEKKKSETRLRVILGMRAVGLLLIAALGLLLSFSSPVILADGSSPLADAVAKDKDSWELDSRATPSGGGAADPSAADPDQDDDGSVDGTSGQDRRKLPPIFVRGDVTLDRWIDLSDVLAVITYLTHGGEISCADAADVNDDGHIDLTDPIRLIRFLYIDEAIPGVDGLEEHDETADELGCGD